MNEKQKAALLAIGGEEFVKTIEREGEKRTKELEGLGVSYKAQPEAEAEAEGEKAKSGKWSQKVRALAKKVEDKALRDELTKLCDEMDESYPYPKPGRKEESEAEDEKARAKRWAKYSKRLRALADKAEDKDADELKALADALDKADADEEAKAGKPPEDEYGKPGTKEEPLARAEVADALTAVVESLRAEIKAASEATTKAVTGQVAESLKPLVAEVKALSRTDEEKVAEKAAGTPAASLAEIMSSVIGSPETRVDAKDLGGPKEAEPRKALGPTGISLLDDWITGADQQRPQ